MQIKTNKHGYPGAYCFACEVQYQPRDDASALLLMGTIHTWQEEQRGAVEGMLAADDVEQMRPKLTRLPSTLPLHLQQRSRPTPAPAPAQPKRRTGFLDRTL